jgi:hypothetical protein
VARFKLQAQTDTARAEVWHDVRAENGTVLVFDTEADARARLQTLFPVLIKMEALGLDRKRTRVVIIDAYQDIDDEKED